MKTLLSSLVSCALILTLTACGQKGSDELTLDQAISKAEAAGIDIGTEYRHGDLHIAYIALVNVRRTPEAIHKAQMALDDLQKAIARNTQSDRIYNRSTETITYAIDRLNRCEDDLRMGYRCRGLA